jgi:hypothetical protein
VSVETLPGVASLLNRLATFRYSLFRLETLQAYSGSSEDEAYEAYRAGQPIPVTQELAEWCERISQRTAEGAAVQRVHVVAEPLTDYIRFELASYAPNVEAGEDVRVIPVRERGPWPLDVGREDFWLVDSRELWGMAYDDDGTWLGTEVIIDPTLVVGACAIRDAALAQATPWPTYMNR